MNSRAAIRTAIVTVTFVSLAGLMNSAAAAPLAPATTAMTASTGFDATQVRSRHGGGGGALAAGLLTGMMIGGLFAAPGYYEPYPYYPSPYGGYYVPRYSAPIGYGTPGWEAYCISRFRSFDPVSGTYLGRDGRRHYCG